MVRFGVLLRTSWMANTARLVKSSRAEAGGWVQVGEGQRCLELMWLLRLAGLAYFLAHQSRGQTWSKVRGLVRGVVERGVEAARGYGEEGGGEERREEF
jgi:hypothetical protein